MRLNYNGKNIQVTESLKDVAEKKLGRLDKYFDAEVAGNVLFSLEKNARVVEVTIQLPEGAYIRTEQSTDDMYSSIDRAVDGLEAQIRKHKGKMQKRYAEKGKSIRFENIPSMESQVKETSKIVKVKRFALRPMDPEEAVLQMELLGHNFFVFLEPDMTQFGIVYKRKDGNYGLLEPEI